MGKKKKYMIKHIYYRLITFDNMLIKSNKPPSFIWFYLFYLVCGLGYFMTVRFSKKFSSRISDIY